MSYHIKVKETEDGGVKSLPGQTRAQLLRRNKSLVKQQNITAPRYLCTKREYATPRAIRLC
ncbi:hypothetical protein J6590_082269 [Homalodisca vitripennis]|nr:hypothetical protein J6590_082269 [Homalodisca vitripennis]